MRIIEDLKRTDDIKDSNSGLKKLNNFIQRNYDIYSTFKNTRNIEFLYKVIFECFEELGDFSKWKSATFLDTELNEDIKVSDVLKNFIEDIVSHISKSDILEYYTCYDYHGKRKEQFLSYMNSVSKDEWKNVPYNRVIIVELPKFIKSISHQDFKRYLYIKWNNEGDLLSFHDIDNEMEDNEDYLLEDLDFMAIHITEKKQEYFVDFYKDKLGEHEVKVEALWDKNGKELYNGAKAILDVLWGDGKEVGKVVISKFVTDEFDGYGFKVIFSYAFKPKKGSQLWIEQDGSNIELI